MVTLQGQTFGTVSYNIQYIDEEGRVFKPQVDSILQAFNQCLSTYIPNSEISRFNKKGLHKFEASYFYEVLNASMEVFMETKGAFDPTVGPLIDAWGFGPQAPIYPDSATVDSLLQFVAFDKVFFDSISVCRLKRGIELSFSAIAKGQGVDVVANYLRDQGMQDVLVEIGGEMTAYGHFAEQRPWIAGIEDPNSPLEARNAMFRVALQDRAMATSGNYRNYYERNGRKYAHTIDPISGYPVQHNLLSATVFAENCMLADAYATAFMVMGMARSREVLSQHPELDAVLIFDTGVDTLSYYITPGILPSVLD